MHQVETVAKYIHLKQFYRLMIFLSIPEFTITQALEYGTHLFILLLYSWYCTCGGQ